MTNPAEASEEAGQGRCTENGSERDFSHVTVSVQVQCNIPTSEESLDSVSAWYNVTFPTSEELWCLLSKAHSSAHKGGWLNGTLSMLDLIWVVLPAALSGQHSGDKTPSIMKLQTSAIVPSCGLASSWDTAWASLDYMQVSCNADISGV